MPLILTCKQASRLISDRQDGHIGNVSMLRLRMHLHVCQACRQFSAQLEFLRRAMTAYATTSGHPDEERMNPKTGTRSPD